MNDEPQQQRARELVEQFYDDEYPETQQQLIDAVAVFAATEHQRGVDEERKRAAEIADSYDIDTDDPERKFHTPSRIASQIRIGKGEDENNA